MLRVTMEFLQELFKQSIISIWIPRSPGLSPLDNFLQRYFKNMVYEDAVATLKELK